MPSRRISRVLLAIVTATLLFVVSAIPAWSMTVTFVRHGESQANAEHIIETDIPGRGLTAQGEAEAEAVATLLAANGHDAIYSSPLKRTLETAEFFAGDEPIEELVGLREIPGGWFEGASDDGGIERLLYGLPAMAWTLGLRFIPVLGSEDGNAFDARVDGALRQMYDDGAENPVAFGHGATIMFWTMMNVDNPDLLLMLTNTLGNTDTVVIEGSPDEGWTLVSWAGVDVDSNPSLITKLFVNTRDLVVAPQTALYDVGQAFATGDIMQIADAVRNGLVDVATAAVSYVPNVVRSIVESVGGVSPLSVDRPSSAGTETLRAAESPEVFEPTPAGAQATAAARDSGRVVKAPEPTVASKLPVTSELPETGTLAVVTDDQKANGATDLSTGNKAQPGRLSTLPRPRAQLSEALQDVGDQFGGVVKRFTGAPESAAPTAETGVDDDDAGGDSGEGAAA